MPDRIACIVPFCPRTRGDRKGDPLTPNMEWLCQVHWPLVPKRLKRRRSKLRRLARRTSDTTRLARIKRADIAAWKACKAAAIERSAGI